MQWQLASIHGSADEMLQPKDSENHRIGVVGDGWTRITREGALTCELTAAKFPRGHPLCSSEFYLHSVKGFKADTVHTEFFIIS